MSGSFDQSLNPAHEETSDFSQFFTAARSCFLSTSVKDQYRLCWSFNLAIAMDIFHKKLASQEFFKRGEFGSRDPSFLNPRSRFPAHFREYHQEFDNLIPAFTHHLGCPRIYPDKPIAETKSEDGKSLKVTFVKHGQFRSSKVPIFHLPFLVTAVPVPVVAGASLGIFHVLGNACAAP